LCCTGGDAMFQYSSVLCPIVLQIVVEVFASCKAKSTAFILNNKGQYTLVYTTKIVGFFLTKTPLISQDDRLQLRLYN